MGLESNRKPADAVYRQKEIHTKVMSQNFTNCDIKILHVDAHAILNDRVVVQVMGLLSKTNQALRRFMQTFILAPEGSVANTFYAYKDIFVTKPQEESEEEAQELEERQQTPEVVPDDSGTFCDQTVSSDFEEHLEEPVVELEPCQSQSWSRSRSREPVPNLQEVKPEPALEEAAPRMCRRVLPQSWQSWPRHRRT